MTKKQIRERYASLGFLALYSGKKRKFFIERVSARDKSKINALVNENGVSK